MNKEYPYFERKPDDPSPLELTLTRRVRFSETDPTGTVWYGRYAWYFEEAVLETARLAGLTTDAQIAANLASPVAQFYLDVRIPLQIDELFTITCRLFWNEGPRIDSELVIRNSAGAFACTGYVVQMFVDLKTRKAFWCDPPLWSDIREKWRKGAFSHDA